MISLRLRLALVLVAAIVAVVVVAVFATVQLVLGPHEGALERTFAKNAATITSLVGGSADRARAVGLSVDPPPNPASSEGVLVEPPMEAVIVSDRGGERHLAVRLSDSEWLRLPFPGQPPSPLLALSAYLMLVVVGTSAIALLVAARILGPLRLLEGALAAVRTDGTLTPVPERGPPEVRATVRALNLLSNRLKAAMDSRMRLVAAAGHDLRTPMTRLRLRAEFLPNGERERWLHDLEELDRIADSAISLVREEADETAMTPTSLTPLVQGVVDELMEVDLPAKFEGGVDVLVRMQPLSMKRAVRNLVENAVRHGGDATVRVETRNGDALIVVEDRGPGIPKELIDRVFEPFFRVDPARRKTHEGAGLGLSIANEIVERHGGSLTIANRDGGGLRQEVRLPRTRSVEASPA